MSRTDSAQVPFGIRAQVEEMTGGPHVGEKRKWAERVQRPNCGTNGDSETDTREFAAEAREAWRGYDVPYGHGRN